MREGDTLSFILANQLGSATVTLDSTGSVQSELRYHPFGETRHSDGTTPTKRRFTGQIQDEGTGLYYYNARYYDPAIGRFIQADTIVPEPGNPQSLNRYSYVYNNPLKYTDPSGHDVMLVGGFGSTDWNDPIGWREWIMTYKDWNDSQWKQFHSDWMAGNDAERHALMQSTGVHIFNWGECGCGEELSDNSRNATVNWGVYALGRQMAGMEDITLVGHSKGGNLVFNYISDYDEQNRVKNAIIIAAPLAQRNPFVHIAGASGHTRNKDGTVSPGMYAGGTNIVNITHPNDPIGNGISGATNRIDRSDLHPPAAHSFHRTFGWPRQALMVNSTIVGDSSARTGVYEYPTALYPAAVSTTVGAK